MIASLGAPKPFAKLNAAVCLTLLWASLPLACSKKDKPSSDAPSPVAAPVVKKAPTPPTKCEAGPDGRCTASASCSPTCQVLASPECVQCEAAGDCHIFANNCEDPILSAADRAICYEIQACVQSSNCFDGADATLGSCYCGKLSTKECLSAPMSGPGAPAGVCHDVILKGFPNAKTQSHVLGNLTTRTFAGGLALSRLNCQKIGYRQLCANTCGFGPLAPTALQASLPH